LSEFSFHLPALSIIFVTLRSLTICTAHLFVQGYNKLPPADGITLDTVDPETALGTTSTSAHVKTGDAWGSATKGNDSVYRYRYSSVIKSEVRGSEVVKSIAKSGSTTTRTGDAGAASMSNANTGGGISGVSSGVSSGGGFVGGVTTSANGKKFFSHAPKPFIQRSAELTSTASTSTNAV